MLSAKPSTQVNAIAAQTAGDQCVAKVSARTFWKKLSGADAACATPAAEPDDEWLPTPAVGPGLAVVVVLDAGLMAGVGVLVLGALLAAVEVWPDPLAVLFVWGDEVVGGAGVLVVWAVRASTSLTSAFQNDGRVE